MDDLRIDKLISRIRTMIYMGATKEDIISSIHKSGETDDYLIYLAYKAAKLLEKE